MEHKEGHNNHPSDNHTHTHLGGNSFCGVFMHPLSKLRVESLDVKQAGGASGEIAVWWSGEGLTGVLIPRWWRSTLSGLLSGLRSSMLVVRSRNLLKEEKYEIVLKVVVH